MYCTGCGCELKLGVKFCTNCGKPTSLADSDNVGKIIVIREKKMMAWAISFDVYIDDTSLGSLKNGTTLETNVPLGTHEIKLSSTEATITREIELTSSKKEATVYVIPRMGMITAKPFVKEITYN